MVPCILICLHKFEFSFKLCTQYRILKPLKTSSVFRLFCIICRANVGGHCYVNLVRSLMIFNKIPLKFQSLLTLG